MSGGANYLSRHGTKFCLLDAKKENVHIVTFLMQLMDKRSVSERSFTLKVSWLNTVCCQALHSQTIININHNHSSIYQTSKALVDVARHLLLSSGESVFIKNIQLIFSIPWSTKNYQFR